MSSTDDHLVIIGGGAGGFSTAQTYRKNGGRGRVTLLSTEGFPPYRRTRLTKEYLRGAMEIEDLPLEGARWYEENGVELRLLARVDRLDTGRRLVVTEEGEEITYSTCVLATGSEPSRIPVPGAEDPGILTMRVIGDSDRMRSLAREGDTAVVVGSGFIGCEVSASLALRGVRVTLVSHEPGPQRNRLGKEVSRRIRGWLEGYGVEIIPGAGVKGIEKNSGGYTVSAEGGVKVRGSTVLLATSVAPRIQLAEAAGLKTTKGGILCDASMRTSEPNVFAVGDVAFAMNEAAGRHLHVEHWGEAINHGKVAGTILAGKGGAWDVAPGFWSNMGHKQLKYVAWGDGYDEVSFVDHGGGAFAAWYGKAGVCVGALTHEADEDYERGRKLVESKASLPSDTS